MRGAALVVALAAAGCTETHWTALPFPIPMTLSGDSGGMMGAGTFFTDPTILPTVVDTGTVLTTYDDGTGATKAPTGELTLFGVSQGVDIPRVHITDVQFFEAPLGSLGVDASATKVGAIFAGDNLSRFAAAFDYRGATPTLTLTESLIPCSCEFQPQPGAAECASRFDCSADIAFSLAGGQNSALQSQTRVIVGNNQYTYPPTRVLIDTCIEPFPDPLTTVVPGNSDYAVCSTVSAVCPSPQYLPSGVDTSMLVASGFPGLALSAGAYDRLRGPGAAAALMAAGPTVMLHLPDAADSPGVAAAQTTLGRAPSEEDPGAAALALVSHEYYFGPCALLARSRRIRRGNSVAAERTPCLLGPHHQCEQGGQMAVDPYSAACQNATGNSKCGDDDPSTPTPAVIELAASIPVYVLSDVSPLFLGINADVRPSEATVEGVIGTEVLQRLVTTIDYPGSRLVARCASDDNCKAYPRLSLPDPVPDSCDAFCHGARSMGKCPGGLAACTVAP